MNMGRTAHNLRAVLLMNLLVYTRYRFGIYTYFNHMIYETIIDSYSHHSGRKRFVAH